MIERYRAPQITNQKATLYIAVYMAKDRSMSYTALYRVAF